MTISLYVGESYRVNDTMNIRVLATRGSRVKLGVAGSEEISAPTRSKKGYFEYSEGRRWFVAWHDSGRDSTTSEQQSLSVLHVKGNRVAVEVG